jgi:chromosome segregation ATPase
MFGISDIMDGIGAVFKAIMKFVAWLIDLVRTYPKTTAAIVVCLALAFAGWRLHSHVESLNSQIVTLQDEKAHLEKLKVELTESLLKAVEANEINQELLEKITKDKETLAAIVKGLRESGKATNAQLDDLKKQLDSLGAEDNGPVAKILREAIKGIEANRREREKTWTK